MWGTGGIAPLFLTLDLDGGEWPVKYNFFGEKFLAF